MYGSSLQGSSGYGGGWAGTPYSSPFATQGRMWTPMHIKLLFDTCKYYYLMNPLINAATTKMATYPVTELLVKEQDKELRDFYESYFTETIDLRTKLIEAGLDYNVYGNMLSSIMFPFIKYLTCRGCGHRSAAKDSRFTYSDGTFTKHCSKCGHQGVAGVADVYMRNANAIRIVRWNPRDFKIIQGDIYGEKIYEWQMPAMLRHDITTGKPHVVANTPQEFLDAVRTNDSIVFPANRVFHMKRPSISTSTLGRAWGVPMILPVVEDVYYLQILRKAQEMIASEHLVPLRILFPQGTGAGDQPYSMMNLGEWKDQVEEELQKFRRDRNYTPILPVPIGNQTVSGDGRALLLHQEIRAISEQIIAGMNVPIEFVFGGLSYSGSSVSMRMLENSMLNYRQEHLRYMTWIMRQVSDYMGWPFAKLELRDFRMADDLNRRQYIFNLWQAGLLCDQALLEESGFDASEQKEKRQSEEKAKFSEQERTMLAQTKTQVKASRIQMLGQFELQNEMAELQGAGQMAPAQDPESAEQGFYDSVESPLDVSQTPGEAPLPEQQGGTVALNLLEYAKQTAQRLMTLDPNQRANELARIRTQQPSLAQEVARIMREQSGGNQTQAALPEQRPPRRGAESALI